MALLNLAILIPLLISSTKLETIHLPYLAAISLILATIYLSSKSRTIYLLDFSCYRPSDSDRVPLSLFLEYAELSPDITRESVDFQTKLLERSGIGNDSCVPAALHELPQNTSLQSSCLEIETVLFTIIEDLFSKQNINPKTIDILITNCSLFSPTPSMSSMIVNRFGMRSNVLSYHLSGMGCSAGLLAISLAKDLLKVHKNSLALVLSLEAITPNGYRGKDKSMLLTNCLFRMGGAAILLSNRSKDKKTAKYVLQHLVRTHMGFDDRAYRCVIQEPDQEGQVGVSLSRGIMHVAGDALKANIASLGPLVLPISEKLRYGLSVFRRKMSVSGKDSKLYVPDFKRAFEHFCIHAGGRGVIEAMEGNLRLRPCDVEASKMALYRFGNTSSSSIWYELSYLQAKGRMKKGDRVWQIAFGSGFKCNSAVWKCVSEVKTGVEIAWSDRIHLYPVDVPQVLDH